MQAIVIIVLILAVLLVIFTLQNSIEITLNVFFWEITNAPLVLVLICCVLLGYLIAAIYLYPRLWKLKKRVKELSRGNQNQSGESITNEQPEVKDPEGISLDDNEEDNSFFNE